MAAPTPRPRVLLVDDDSAITEVLGGFLARSGFDVELAADGAQGLAAVRARPPDVVVTDVAMPTMDGRELLRRLRQQGSWIPVVMLTQLGEAGERAMALDEGADDYLNKPFEPVELVARIRAVLRRASGPTASGPRTEVTTAGGLRLDRVARRAFLDGHELVLTPKAALLLDFLIAHPGELLTRERLLETLWGYEDPIGTRAVDNRIAELRRVLGDDAERPRFVQTVPGRGYRFVAEVLP